MHDQPWQVRLYSRSLMKKEKVRLIRRRIDFKDKRVFDMGCAQGTVSFQLKKCGGSWVHADLDIANLQVSLPLLGAEVMQMSETALPCRDASMDLVLILDFLEHVQNDRRVLEESLRILRPGGRIVVSTPIRGNGFLLNRLKAGLGLTPGMHGHVRPGYNLTELASLLEGTGFAVEEARTYAKFFVELFELLLNYLFMRKNKKKNRDLRTGGVSPQSSADLEKNRLIFWVYSYLVYPIVYLVTRLDRLLFWKTGYATLVLGRKK